MEIKILLYAGMCFLPLIILAGISKIFYEAVVYLHKWNG